MHRGLWLPITLGVVLIAGFGCDPFEIDRNVDLDACEDSRCLVTGYVFDIEGSPVDGVRITRGGAGVGYALTDEDGFYSIGGNVLGWDYCITPGKEDWVFEPEQLCYEHIHKNHGNQNFTGWVPNRYDIGGYVTDELARPIEGTFMTLEGADDVSVKSDSTGRYVFTGVLEKTDYCVVPFKTGYVFTPTERCYENLSQGYEMQNFVGFEVGASTTGGN